MRVNGMKTSTAIAAAISLIMPQGIVAQDLPDCGEGAGVPCVIEDTGEEITEELFAELPLCEADEEAGAEEDAFPCATEDGDVIVAEDIVDEADEAVRGDAATAAGVEDGSSAAEAPAEAAEAPEVPPADVQAVEEAEAVEAEAVESDSVAEGEAAPEAEAVPEAPAEAPEAEAEVEAEAETVEPEAEVETTEAEPLPEDGTAEADAAASAEAPSTTEGAAGTEGATAETAAEPVTPMEAESSAEPDAAAVAATETPAETTETGDATATATTSTEAGAGDSEAAAAAATETEAPPAAAAEATEEAEVEVVEETVTEETSRSSDEEFETAVGQERKAEKKDDDDDGLSNFEKALLAGLGAAAVGALLNNGDEVVSNTGDRVVVLREGEYRVLKDDDALLRQPGSEVRTERFSDGSTRQTVTRPNGVEIVTIRAADGRVLRRTRVMPDGRRILLFDDTQEVEPVDVTELPDPAPDRVSVSAEDEEALRRALEAAVAADVRRSFSLRQIRDIREVRELAPEIEVDAITFETGSSVIRPDQAQELAALGQALRSAIEERPYEVFLVEGHTDAVGRAEYNLALSDRRAETVALALTEYFDVPPENLVVQGYGESALKIPTQEAERQNRRATVRRITPLLGMDVATNEL